MNKNVYKTIWTEADFDQMDWHDNRLFAMTFGIDEHEIRFDIDYILEWFHPKENEINYKFMVVPATLVFRNVYDLTLNFSLLDIVIDSIYRDNPVQPKNAIHIKTKIEFDWTINTNNGEISFKSVGYTQYARQPSLLSNLQSLNLNTRGGISFDIKSSRVIPPL